MTKPGTGSFTVMAILTSLSGFLWSHQAAAAAASDAQAQVTGILLNIPPGVIADYEAAQSHGGPHRLAGTRRWSRDDGRLKQRGCGRDTQSR